MRTWQAVARAALPMTQVKFEAGLPAGQLTHGMEQNTVCEPALTIFLRQLFTRSISAWRWVQQRRVQQLASRRLRITETVSLGEKRFVSIIQVDGAQFLIGGSSGGVSLLAKLGSNEGDGTETSNTASVSGAAA